MPEAATLSSGLPTRKDEAWRYAAVEALAALPGWREITVEAGQRFDDILIMEDGNGAASTEIQRIRINIGDAAHCTIFGVIASRDYARVEIEVTLGRGAHFEMGGVTVGGRETVREFVTHVIHAQPEATSNQTVRSVHWGKGTGNFLGNIDVVRHAQKTDAAQDFKGLLLEKGASVNAVPQLEIFADDVKCAHGATVGQLDEAAKFYMAARGISPDLARRLLVQAFIGDAFVEMEDDEAREGLMQVALDKLDRHL